MAPARRGFLALVKRYPEHAALVERLYGNDKEFSTLCEDYQVCSEALQYWNQADSEEAPKRRQEYTSLLKDLEEEVRQVLITETGKLSTEGKCL
jgi:hypothetical protein